MVFDEGTIEMDFDPGARELCPDGACLGVIGPDGRCRVCGKVSPDGPSPAPDPGQSSPPEEPPDTEDSGALARGFSGAGAAEGDERGFDPDSRELCPDGACLGVIGPDGRCKICGRGAK